MRITGFQMRAVGQPLERTTREMTGLAAGEVLVEVAGCGVCHTDLGFLDDGVPTRHALPLVLGHEVAGTVVAAGAGEENLVGHRVIVPAVIPCGRCALCRKDRGDICKSQVFPGNDVHGGFASHLVVPAHGLCDVTMGELDRKQLAQLSVCADAVSTAYQAVRKSGLSRGDFALFVGVGGVGGFGVQVARAHGARVLALDVDGSKLALMREHGAEWALDVREQTPKEVRARVRDLTRDAGVAATEWKIFETSGTRAGQELAFGLLTHGAVLSVVGYHPGDVTVRLSNLMAFAARAEGTWGCPPERFPEVLELVKSGQIEIEPFVEVHPMSTINEVLDKLRRHELKRRPVLVPDFAEAIGEERPAGTGKEKRR